MKFNEVANILLNNGWYLARVSKSSHYQYKKIGVNYIATVPNHGSSDISIGVLKNLEKGTSLPFVKR